MLNLSGHGEQKFRSDHRIGQETVETGGGKSTPKKKGSLSGFWERVSRVSESTPNGTKAALIKNESRRGKRCKAEGGRKGKDLQKKGGKGNCSLKKKGV